MSAFAIAGRYKTQRNRRQLKSVAMLEKAALPLEAVSTQLRIRNDRLSRAGFYTEERRQIALTWVGGVATLVLCAILAIALSFSLSFPAFAVSFFATGYLGLTAWLLFLRAKAAAFERRILFYLPLTLEQLLLLVQSGLGVLPAIAQLSSQAETNPVVYYLQAAYAEAERGLQLRDAVSVVAAQCPYPSLRHFLLHLEAAVAEGAELTSALRNLSDAAHTEWQVALEGVVRTLESAVVFPVFLSVLGLLFLVAAVPLVPIVEFSKTMNERQVGQRYEVVR